MRFCCLFHRNHNFYTAEPVMERERVPELRNDTDNTVQQLFHRRVGFFYFESKLRSVGGTREVIHSMPLGLSPNASLPNAENLAEFICDQINAISSTSVGRRSFLRLNGEQESPQKRESSCCSQSVCFNGLNV